MYPGAANIPEATDYRGAFMANIQALRKIVHGLVHRSARQPFIFKRIWLPLWRLSSMARNSREWEKWSPSISQGGFIESISPQRTVLHGPFKGMKYPETSAVGSSLAPKILGSYEFELHPVFARVLSEPYQAVVDIGCAEGYYAIGLAMKLPNATVHAYDTEKLARSLCLQMAKLNGVEDRVQIGSFCDASTLLQLALPAPALIISDCEGFERSLFTGEVCQKLRQHDVLIEVHDNKDPEIPDYLCDTFDKTHAVEIFSSVADRRRPTAFPCAELNAYDKLTQVSLMAELRSAQMEWFFFRSRLAGSQASPLVEKIP